MNQVNLVERSHLSQSEFERRQINLLFFQVCFEDSFLPLSIRASRQVSESWRIFEGEVVHCTSFTSENICKRTIKFEMMLFLCLFCCFSSCNPLIHLLFKYDLTVRKLIWRIRRQSFDRLFPHFFRKIKGEFPDTILIFNP